jgi:hypothetical protein
MKSPFCFDPQHKRPFMDEARGLLAWRMATPDRYDCIVVRGIEVDAPRPPGPREVVKCALRHNAAAVIFAQSHDRLHEVIGEAGILDKTASELRGLEMGVYPPADPVGGRTTR